MKGGKRGTEDKAVVYVQDDNTQGVMPFAGISLSPAAAAAAGPKKKKAQTCSCKGICEWVGEWIFYSRDCARDISLHTGVGGFFLSAARSCKK